MGNTSSFLYKSKHKPKQVNRKHKSDLAEQRSEEQGKWATHRRGRICHLCGHIIAVGAGDGLPPDTYCCTSGRDPPSLGSRGQTEGKNPPSLITDGWTWGRDLSALRAGGRPGGWYLLPLVAGGRMRARSVPSAGGWMGGGDLMPPCGGAQTASRENEKCENRR
jgi:hypothetical protein